ncbi:MAG: Prephenate dehydratase, partial [Phenylobacterium sp.]|nr:Prephenate dehydratase [Phenylobacterium sp.]
KPIHFQLMANPGVKLEDIKTAVSMPFALGQCRKTMRRLKLKGEGVGDTAGAAKLLSEHPDPTKAAVSPALAAEIYGLEILLRDIEDEHTNTTRFLVMTADRDPAPPPFTSPCVTSFVFRVRNLPAALYKALGGFATNGVNMTKLESYMENGAWSATFFYSEVDGRPEDRGLALAFEELRFFSERFEILGVYPADPFRTRG